MLQEPRLRRQGDIRALVAAVVAVGAVTGCVALRKVSAAEPGQKQSSANRPPLTTAQVAARTAPLADIESAFIAIAERLEPSVVSIRVNKTMRAPAMSPGLGQFFQDMPGFEGQMPQLRNTPRQFQVKGAGSGVIVRSDGWILTNDHVAGGADKVIVKLHDGREFPGTVRRDFRSDLALVKINASNLVPVELADSERVRVGQWAIAFGSPFELEDTMTAGIISARARQQAIGQGSDGRAYFNLLQTDAAINPGNSGGPLVDIHGRLIGVNVAIESPSGGSVGIGFAIPSNTAKDVMEQLISKGRVTRGFLGVVPRALTYDEKQKNSVSNGAMVEVVSNDTPASRAGFHPGDIVLRVNGRPIQDDVAFRDEVGHLAPNSRVEFLVKRDGREQTVSATVGTAPDDVAAANQPAERTAGGKMGIRVEPVTPDVAQKYNLGGSQGVMIVEVQSGSAAEEAGLRPQMVITRVNGKAIRNQDDLAKAIELTRSGDTINLVVVADKSQRLVNVKMP
jgi:serine protease Do